MRTEDDEAAQIELEPEIEQDNEPADEPEGAEDAEPQPEEEPEVLVVQIGDDEPEPDETVGAPQWAKDLRRKNREDAKRIRDLEAQLAEKGKKPAEELGPEPQESDAGIDYDAKAYRDAWNAWDTKRKALEASRERAREEQAKADEAWKAKLAAMQERKAELKVPDMDDAEHFMRENFSVTQIGIMVQGAKDPALLSLALYRNKTKALELAKIADPIEYAFALANTEAQMKVGTRNAPPAPERSLRSGGTGGASTVDSTLEKLREQAAKTGDYSKVVAHKAKMADKARAA